MRRCYRSDPSPSPTSARSSARSRRSCGGRVGRPLSTNVDERVVSALREAQHVVVLTGSGASAESGVPTFRDKQVGLWERFDAMELATPAAFRRDPALVWGWCV